MKVFAHGVGGAQDLPLPLAFALSGGAAALGLSFIVLALAWRRSRFDARTGGVLLPERLDRALGPDGAGTWALRVVGLAIAVYVAWAAIAGPDTAVNPTFIFVFVLLWVGLVPASLLFGPIYAAMNPVRTIHRLLSRVTGGDPDAGVVALPSWVGLWPAALGLFGFVYLELVYPESNYLAPVRLWFAIYIAVLLVGAAVFGDRWIEQTDPFEAYSRLLAHLSLFGRRADGRLVLRSPLHNLDGVPQVPVGHGRPAFVADRLWRIPLEDAFADVTLPLGLNWSTPGAVFDLADRRRRARCYEIVLREGTQADLLRFIDGALLVDAWPGLVLPRELRTAWKSVIETVVT